MLRDGPSLHACDPLSSFPLTPAFFNNLGPTMFFIPQSVPTDAPIFCSPMHPFSTAPCACFLKPMHPLSRACAIRDGEGQCANVVSHHSVGHVHAISVLLADLGCRRGANIIDRMGCWHGWELALTMEQGSVTLWMGSGVQA